MLGNLREAGNVVWLQTVALRSRPVAPGAEVLPKEESMTTTRWVIRDSETGKYVANCGFTDDLHHARLFDTKDNATEWERAIPVRVTIEEINHDPR